MKRAAPDGAVLLGLPALATYRTTTTDSGPIRTSDFQPDGQVKVVGIAYLRSDEEIIFNAV
jgi:hypothetical protein